MRHTTEVNLAHCFPELSKEQRQQLARQSICETGRLMVETALVWKRPYHWLHKRLKFNGSEKLLLDAVASKQGVILLAPHIGNWEAMGMYLAEVGDYISPLG